MWDHYLNSDKIKWVDAPKKYVMNFLIVIFIFFSTLLFFRSQFQVFVSVEGKKFEISNILCRLIVFVVGSLWMLLSLLFLLVVCIVRMLVILKEEGFNWNLLCIRREPRIKKITFNIYSKKKKSNMRVDRIFLLLTFWRFGLNEDLLAKKK